MESGPTTNVSGAYIGVKNKVSNVYIEGFPVMSYVVYFIIYG